MKNYVQQIVNMMYADEETAQKLASLIDIPPDPDTAAEYLTMLTDEMLKDIISKLKEGI